MLTSLYTLWERQAWQTGLTPACHLPAMPNGIWAGEEDRLSRTWPCLPSRGNGLHPISWWVVIFERQEASLLSCPKWAFPVTPSPPTQTSYHSHFLLHGVRWQAVETGTGMGRWADTWQAHSKLLGTFGILGIWGIWAWLALWPFGWAGSWRLVGKGRHFAGMAFIFVQAGMAVWGRQLTCP